MSTLKENTLNAVEIAAEIEKSFTERIDDMSYDELVESLRIRLVDPRNDTVGLKAMAALPSDGGYMIVPYMTLEEDERRRISAYITKSLADRLAPNERWLVADAIKHAARNNPPVMRSLENMLFDFLPDPKAENLLDPDCPEEAFPESLPDQANLFVVTCKDTRYGACALFYPGVQAQVAKIMQGDYYVLPSSVHEVLVLKDSDRMTPRELAELVKSINEEQVLPEERLGNKVLKYRTDLERLVVAEDLDREPDRGKER